MTKNGKRELLEAIRPRYLRASTTEKTHILNEFVAITGYHRKYAIRLLKHGRKQQRREKRGRSKVYQGEVVSTLIKVWEVCDRICSRRLHPFLPEIVAVLEREEELGLSEETKGLLLHMSRASIDRCLQAVRYQRRRGRSTTKPGTLLKQAIPVRTFADWDDVRPGFVEMDLVAHCGDSTHGEYLHTLNVVDIAIRWSECLILANRSQRQVTAAMDRLRARLPFPLLGIDSDNDSAFINDNLYRYCQQEHITFTRSRPYKKNDQAHIEQKNWSVVRRLIGYDRYESAEEQALMEAIYQDWRLYVNFLQPVLKLVEKRRVGRQAGGTPRTEPRATPRAGWLRRLYSPPDATTTTHHNREMAIRMSSDPLALLGLLFLYLDMLSSLKSLYLFGEVVFTCPFPANICRCTMDPAPKSIGISERN